MEEVLVVLGEKRIVATVMVDFLSDCVRSTDKPRLS